MAELESKSEVAQLLEAMKLQTQQISALQLAIASLSNQDKINKTSNSYKVAVVGTDDNRIISPIQKVYSMKKYNPEKEGKRRIETVTVKSVTVTPKKHMRVMIAKRLSDGTEREHPFMIWCK